MADRAKLAAAAAAKAVGAAATEVCAEYGEGVDEAAMREELAAMEQQNEALRSRLQDARLKCEPTDSLPADLATAHEQILTLRQGVQRLSDAVAEGLGVVRTVERQFGRPESTATAVEGEPPLTPRSAALEVEVQELTHRALSLELEDLLRANLATVAPAPALRCPEPEPEPEPGSNHLTHSDAVAIGHFVHDAKELYHQADEVDDEDIAGDNDVPGPEPAAARRSQEEQDFSDWVGRWKRDLGPAERVAVQKQLKKARAKFEEIDSHGDGNGVLNGAELEELARWVFSGFHPAGEQLDAQQQQAQATTLLARLDKNRDGVLGFDEFADWFTFTCAEMHRYREQGSWAEGRPEPARGDAAQAAGPAAAGETRNENAASVSFAEPAPSRPSKRIVRQQTGLGEAASDSKQEEPAQATNADSGARTVGFAEGTNTDRPKKRLIRQQTGLGESAPPVDSEPEKAVAFAEGVRSQPTKRIVRTLTAPIPVDPEDDDDEYSDDEEFVEQEEEQEEEEEGGAVTDELEEPWVDLAAEEEEGLGDDLVVGAPLPPGLRPGGWALLKMAETRRELHEQAVAATKQMQSRAQVGLHLRIPRLAPFVTSS